MISNSSSDLSQKTFDFVVVGGGVSKTAGLALAVRLSENSAFTVAVLEAGGDTFDDPIVTIPGQFGLAIADPKYDWAFYTTAQPFADGKQVLWSRGKGLGGSSTINFYAWTKPPAGDIDAIEKLGNAGWNWKDYCHYSMKSERFSPPLKEVTDLFPHTYDINARGASGPISYTISPHAHTIDSVVHETCANLGLKVVDDPYKGNINGTWVASANLDRETWARSSSRSAYLEPRKDRRNITVLPHALASKVIFAEGLDEHSDDLVATGVEFIHQDQTFIVNARKEVILSTGTPVNPKILELSGVGRREILDKIGVEVKLELPGVGENLQEHLLFVTTYELHQSVDHPTLDRLRDPEYANEARRLIMQGPATLRITQISIRAILRGIQVCVHLLNLVTQHGAYMDKDLELLVEHLKYTRTMAQTEPLKSSIVGVELEKGLAECKTDEQLRGIFTGLYLLIQLR
ncbi:hypothetical protein H0H87_008312 [Tephrocybe sp. NHM501043]|nr:hypothetical protein H0H87_008312 [Tephrocybe sp. NHM501043]